MGSMNLLPGDNREDKDKKLDPVYDSLSRKLYNLLHQKNDGRVSMKEVKAQLLKLTKLHSPEEIVEVVDYYTTHINEEFLPSIYSARHLRQKYDRIVNHINRKDISPLVKIPKEIMIFAANLRRTFSFPPGTDIQLEMFLTKSVENYSIFWKKVEVYEHKIQEQEKGCAVEEDGKIIHKALSPVPRLFLHLRACRFFIPPIYFVERVWVPLILGVIAKWSTWNGDLVRLCFKTDSKFFLKLGYAHTHNFCNTSIYFDNLLEAIHAD